jgi:sulfotransferase
MNAWSNAPAVRNQIDAEKDLYFERFKRVARGIIKNWYSVRDEKVVFDKCRGWSANWITLKTIVDAPKMIVTVRDLRDIVASVVAKSDETNLFVGNLPLTLDGKVTAMLAPDGVAGGPLNALFDLQLREVLNSDSVFVWKYEDFCTNPTDVMQSLYEFLGEPYFDHNFKNVEKAHSEDDSTWCYTYPHEGIGEIRPPATDYWRKALPETIASTIWERHKWYFEAFGYER